MLSGCVLMPDDADVVTLPISAARVRCFPPSTTKSAMIPEGMLRDGRLKPVSRCMISALLYHALDRDWCTPTDAALRQYLKCGRVRIRTALGQLEEHGYIRAERVPKTPKNPAGRVIYLHWIYDDSVVPDHPPFRRG